MERVKERLPGDLSHIAPFQLTVWRCMDLTTSFDDEDLKRQVSEVFSSNSVKMLRGRQAIAELNISTNEILFVKLPSRPVITSDQVGDPSTLHVVREYEHCFLKARSKGCFTEGDVESNEIVDANDRDAPEFVKKYRQMLGRKRKVAHNMYGAADLLVGGEDYFDYSTPNVSESVDVEVFHLIQISSLYRPKRWDTLKNGNPRPFKECDANWLFFYTIANHIDSHLSNIELTESPRLSVKLGQES
ncbi:hypothetical protein EDB92DRAFT_2115093 [Lactarius akahatsu]|uniref:Uncharacterized protein n=1 Tax=Lactarius akahatsu TaxID=416441 RepID=A0AAD4QD28_9AGAM|nr:hypothetical protein EDB92DRAFT_2115093 [Lactarius akahatsu]